MPHGFDNPTLGEILYGLSSMIWFMEDGGFYHDRHMATLSTDLMRTIVYAGNVKFRYINRK